MQDSKLKYEIVVTVKTLIPKGKSQFTSCVLSSSRIPNVNDRDYLIDVVNTQTNLFCDDIVTIVYRGAVLWDLPEDQHYVDYWEDRNKLKE